MKEKDLEFLTNIYQNARTGIQSINDILPKVTDLNLKHELSNEITSYELIAKECEMIAGNRFEEVKDNNWFEKTKLWFSIKMNTLLDNSTRHLAEMLLVGTVMGTLDLYKLLNDNQKAPKELLMLCGKLLKLEEDFFNNLKSFLKIYPEKD